MSWTKTLYNYNSVSKLKTMNKQSVTFLKMPLLSCSVTFCLFVICAQQASPETHTYMQTPSHTHTACIQRLSALTVMNCLAMARLRHSLSPWQHMMMSRCSKVYVRMCACICFCAFVFLTQCVFFQWVEPRGHMWVTLGCLLFSLLSSSLSASYFFFSSAMFRMLNVRLLRQKAELLW